ncbi:MAG: hypothetical protein IPM64_12785 [Phycisphaerales bacterium]|nr:hypothetical protein [Phycisphaerales bacterium]
MAGRPATVRGGGLTGVHYLAFSMSGVALILLVTTIVFATQVKDAQSRALNAERRDAENGTAPAYYASEASARGAAVFAVMQEDVDRLAKLAVGQTGVASAVEQQARQVTAAVREQHGAAADPGDSLSTVVAKLSAALAEQKAQLDAASGQVAEGNRKNGELTEKLRTTRTEFDAEVARLAAQFETSEAQKQQMLGAKDKQLADLQATMEQSTQQTNEKEQRWLREGRELKLQLATLQNQVATLQRELAGIKPVSFDPGAILTKADGRVLRAVPGSEIVYINIGAADKLKVGMGFEIYSQTREAPKSLRGKASIEVVSVSEQTAECRVLRTTGGQPIIEGDPVVNIAFERGRQPKFVVVGDYDLNYDGNVDFDGMDKVKGMIRQWGGVVVDQFDETVDFVVIGQAPQIPQLPEFGVSDVVAAQADERSRALVRYRDLIDRARSIYVPVINQNSFLYLTGFAGDAGTMTP